MENIIMKNIIKKQKIETNLKGKKNKKILGKLIIIILAVAIVLFPLLSIISSFIKT
jgi:nitrate reductase NapE component